MDDEELYEVKLIYLDSIEQFKQYEKGIDVTAGVNDDPKVVQYIKFKRR